MILEVADIRIKAGQQTAFEAAVRRGIDTVISKADGFQGVEIRKGVESPERYLVLIRWRTLEAHTVGFRESPLYTQWRELVGPFFASAPAVEHFTLLADTA